MSSSPAPPPQEMVSYHRKHPRNSLVLTRGWEVITEFFRRAKLEVLPYIKVRKLDPSPSLPPYPRVLGEENSKEAQYVETEIGCDVINRGKNTAMRCRAQLRGTAINSRPDAFPKYISLKWLLPDGSIASETDIPCSSDPERRLEALKILSVLGEGRYDHYVNNTLSATITTCIGGKGCLTTIEAGKVTILIIAEGGLKKYFACSIWLTSDPNRLCIVQNMNH